MSSRNHRLPHTAIRRVRGVACAPWCGSFAIAGGYADDSIGLVVVDQGNPRRTSGAANVSFAPF
jgi:hypothetical protein